MSATRTIFRPTHRCPFCGAGMHRTKRKRVALRCTAGHTFAR